MKRELIFPTCRTDEDVRLAVQNYLWNENVVENEEDARQFFVSCYADTCYADTSDLVVRKRVHFSTQVTLWHEEQTIKGRKVFASEIRRVIIYEYFPEGDEENRCFSYHLS